MQGLRPNQSLPDRFRLGRVTVVPARGLIRFGASEVHLEPKTMDLLSYLASRAGQVVSRDELLAAVWPDVFVEENLVARHVSKLRIALGDDSRAPRYVETIRKRGYRLIPSPEAVRPGSASFRRTSALAALGMAAALLSGGPADEAKPLEADVSTDPGAHSLYVESLEHDTDGEGNLVAIRLLEEVVDRAPDFAPAWAQLARRYYFASAYAEGSKETYAELATRAARIAIQSDATLIDPWVVRSSLMVESSRIVEAYHITRKLLDRWPDRFESHKAMAYVYRYAGLLERAAAECGTAAALNPGHNTLRSCSLVFARLGRHEEASRFLAFSDSLTWRRMYGGFLALLREDRAGAENAWGELPQDSPFRGVLADCHLRERFETVRDPEAMFLGAVMASACGRGDESLELLVEANRQNYCTPREFEPGSYFDGLRGQPGWEEARALSRKCRKILERLLDAPPPEAVE